MNPEEDKIARDRLLAYARREGLTQAEAAELAGILEDALREETKACARIARDLGLAVFMGPEEAWTGVLHEFADRINRQILARRF